MNWALLAKLACRMLSCKWELWSEILKAKYEVSEADGANFRRKDMSSQVLKAIVWGAKFLRRGLQWKIHNGKRVFFWKNNWLAAKPRVLWRRSYGMLWLLSTELVEQDGNGICCNSIS